MKVELTLNRCHKVVERLKSKRNDLRESVARLVEPVSITLMKGMNKTTLQQYRTAARLETELNLVTSLSGTIADIKFRVSDMNTKLGINELLADLEAHTFMQQTLANAVSPKKEKQSRYDYSRGSKVTEAAPLGIDDALSILVELDDSTAEVKLSRVDPLVVTRLESNLEKHKASSFSLQDKLSDLNKNRITLEIPDEILEYAGLSKEDK